VSSRTARPIVLDRVSCIGEPIVEAEVDLSMFLAKQRLSDEPSQLVPTTTQSDDDEVDESLAHISSKGINYKKKAAIRNVDWDEELDEMSRNKAIAEANWGSSFSFCFRVIC
jgi:hypothetical protein